MGRVVYEGLKLRESTIDKILAEHKLFKSLKTSVRKDVARHIKRGVQSNPEGSRY